MSDKREDTIIGAIGGILATIGGSAFYQFAREKASQFVVKKATEVFVDRGRGPILRDILMLPAKQSAQLREWLDQAQKEGVEGELINLILKLPDSPTEGRRKEFAKLSKLGSYEEFVTTLKILDQDNAIQIAQRVIKNGGRILDNDVKEFLACIGQEIRRAGTGIDAALRDAAPHLNDFASWIRSKG